MYRTWLATFVKRWHTDPDLSDSNDSIAGHQCRVALLAVQLMPTISKEALLFALTHDLGEWFTGDISTPTKLTHPELKNMVDGIEKNGRASLGFGYIEDKLTDEEKRVLKLCDRLDAFMWRLKHLPNGNDMHEHRRIVHSLLDDALALNKETHTTVNNIICLIEQDYLPKKR